MCTKKGLVALHRHLSLRDFAFFAVFGHEGEEMGENCVRWCTRVLELSRSSAVVPRGNLLSDSAVATVITVHKKRGWALKHTQALRDVAFFGQEQLRGAAVVVKGGRRGGGVAARVRQGGIHFNVSRAKVRGACVPEGLTRGCGIEAQGQLCQHEDCAGGFFGSFHIWVERTLEL